MRKHYARKQPIAPRQGTIVQAFYSTPFAWATNLGFEPATYHTWSLTRTTTSKSAPKHAPIRLGYPQQAIPIAQWQRIADHERLAIIVTCDDMAAMAAMS